MRTIKEEQKYNIEDIVLTGINRLLVAKGQNSKGELSETITMCADFLLKRYSFFTLEDVEQIFERIISGDIEISYINYFEFMKWVLMYANIKNKIQEGIKKESVGEIYQRQTERRKKVLEKRHYNELYDVPNDNLLFTLREAELLGIVSENYRKNIKLMEQRFS